VADSRITIHRSSGSRVCRDPASWSTGARLIIQSPTTTSSTESTAKQPKPVQGTVGVQRRQGKCPAQPVERDTKRPTWLGCASRSNKTSTNWTGGHGSVGKTLIRQGQRRDEVLAAGAPLVCASTVTHTASAAALHRVPCPLNRGEGSDTDTSDRTTSTDRRPRITRGTPGGPRPESTLGFSGSSAQQRRSKSLSDSARGLGSRFGQTRRNGCADVIKDGTNRGTRRWG